MPETPSVEAFQNQIDTLKKEIARLGEENNHLQAEHTADAERYHTLEVHLQNAQSMEAIGILAGGIAHDFNNILGSLQGFTELALDDAEKGSMLEDNLQEVYRACGRARDLVKQIITFVRHTEQPSRPVRVDIIAKEVLKFMRAALPTSVSITKQIRAQQMVMGDPISLHQVLVNLCAHAGQAMHQKGGVLNLRVNDVTLEAENKAGLPAGAYVEIMVTHTGDSLAAEELQRIFQPGPKSPTVEGETLYGLAAVDSVIQKCKGRVLVQSQIGYGAVFQVYLPAVPGEQPCGPYPGAPFRTGTERILFVDDEPAMAKMELQALQKLGYRVTALTSSQAALNLITQDPGGFDVVITDMTMPQMSGDALAERIRTINPRIPIILITGYSRHMDTTRAEALGIQALLTKPVSKEELIDTIRRLLDASAGI
jgi:two-component system cell cycle sensor histidine kinase/response regulator CckA